MRPARSTELWNRVDDRIEEWRIVVERVSETDGSVLVFGRRGTDAVVLKVIKRRGDEWQSGEILDAFEGRGVVRVFEHVEGARATLPTTRDWGLGFDRYVAGGDLQVPRSLVFAARRLHSELSGSQTRVRLLHGDLNHYNVLFDDDRGWLAADPKGVVGELEYEVGAALRNPYERPELFAEPSTIRRRVEGFASILSLDATRVLSWAFGQAVLAAIWAVEDGLIVEPGNRWVALANAIQPMLRRSV